MSFCPFCLNKEAKASYLPGTMFNGNQFRYLSCTACQLIYLDPFPSADDYTKMYPPSYQAGVNLLSIDEKHKLPGLRFPYRKHFELLEKFAPGKLIADYGCGNANFLANAMAKGYTCHGVEYNPDHITILRRSIPNTEFFLTTNFLEDTSIRYDAIRLSNVLEHLENPGKIVDTLCSKLNPSGILLIEGPLEINFSPAFLVRKTYFSLLKNKQAKHPPTHIFFANSKNQRKFFNDHGLTETYIKITECEWPFPETWKDAKGIGGVFMFLIAKFSKIVCSMNNNWGNTFIYVGRA